LAERPEDDRLALPLSVFDPAAHAVGDSTVGVHDRHLGDLAPS
jgi:hypothetical protein